jgi:hypothetical protein
MTAVAGARGGLKAHQDSIRLSEPELVRDLRDILGAKLVAYIGSVKETRAVRQWADGERKPSAEVMTRLRHAYHVAALLAERDYCTKARSRMRHRRSLPLPGHSRQQADVQPQGMPAPGARRIPPRYQARR